MLSLTPRKITPRDRWSLKLMYIQQAMGKMKRVLRISKSGLFGFFFFFSRELDQLYLPTGKSSTRDRFISGEEGEG